MRANEPSGTRIAVLLLIGGVAACSHPTAAAPSDVAVSSADAATGPTPRRRRGRRGARNAVASRGGTTAIGAHASIDRGASDPGAATADDLALGDDPGGGDDEVPAQRPRMTETGPMLSENVGTQANVNYDMREGSGGSGPMGLEPGQIAAGMHPLMSRLSNCAAATGGHGHVSVRLRIQSSGAPTAARVSGPGPAEFTTCVRRVIASARFEHFNGPDALASWGFDVD